MSKYRISVSIDGENFFWVVVDKERFIRNPTIDDRIGTKLISYNKTNICDLCRTNNSITDKSILYPRKAYREYSIKGNWTAKEIRKDNMDIFYAKAYSYIRKRSIEDETLPIESWIDSIFDRETIDLDM